MSDVRLRARSATEIIDAAFGLYRRGFLQLVLATALAYAPWLVVQLVILTIWTPLGQAITPATLASVPTSYVVVNVIVGIGSFVTYSIMSGVLIRLGTQLYLEATPDIRTALASVLPHTVGLIVAALGRAVIYFVAAAAGGIVGMVAGLGVGLVIGRAGGAILGGLLVFVGVLGGGLYVFARYALVNACLVLEDLGVGAAFGRSLTLTRWRALRILGALLLVLVVLLLVYFGTSMVLLSFGSIVAATVLGSVFIILAYPLYALTETLLYYDARIRAEGFDIELLAEGLGAPPSTEQPVP